MKETGADFEVQGYHPNHEALSGSILALEHNSHMMIMLKKKTKKKNYRSHKDSL